MGEDCWDLGQMLPWFGNQQLGGGVFLGKSQFLMGKSQFLMGKSPFLMGKSPFYPDNNGDLW